MNCKKSLLFSLLLILLCIFSAGCSHNTAETDLWSSAVYKEDTELGAGSKTFLTEVSAEEYSVTFTVHTDKETVGEALKEQELIAGEQGAYGLYIKTVNGITADYNKTQSYWSFCKDGEYLQTGVDGESVADGAHYELVYTSVE